MSRRVADRPDRHPGGKRAGRPVGHPRLHQPGPGRSPQRVHRAPVAPDGRGRHRRRRPPARRRPRPRPGRPGGRRRAPCGPSTGSLIFRRTKSEPEIAAELPDKVDKLDHCSMTPEQIGLYQAVVNRLLEGGLDGDANQRKGAVLAAITALKQICDHPAAYLRDDDDQTGLGGPVGQAGPPGGDRRRRVLGRRAHPDLHPLRPLGREAGPASERPHRAEDRLLPRRSEPRRARPAHRRLPEPAPAPAPWCCRSRPAAPGST